MTIFHWVLLAIGIYLTCGVGMMFMLLQTPYQDNPLWVMILLWPLYLWQGI
jgi:hypothetical protein